MSGARRALASSGQAAGYDACAQMRELFAKDARASAASTLSEAGKAADAVITMPLYIEGATYWPKRPVDSRIRSIRSCRTEDRL